MSQFPLTMNRVELLHPIVVHFPIALLVVGSFIFLFHFLIRHEARRSLLHNCALVLLCLGVIAAWAGVYTGDLAEEEVNRVLCDPDQTHEHGDRAEQATWIFTALVGLLLIRQFKTFKQKPQFLINSLSATLAVLGVLLMIDTGHRGAKLVYLQAAAVHVPSPECKEFE